MQYKSFENPVGKGEIARKRAISPFPTVFSTLLKNALPFSSNLKCSSANSFNLGASKMCPLTHSLLIQHFETVPNSKSCRRQLKCG